MKRYNGLWLLNKYGDLYYFCIILVYNLSPLNWKNLKKVKEREKLKASTMPVT